MIPLILFVALGLVILVLFELRARKQARNGEDTAPAPTSDGECCGQHLVCERDTLLQKTDTIEYYDDEELDALAGIAPEDYTAAQVEEIEQVFETLQEKDVAGWVRSLQLRNIALPESVREEALLVVRERRAQQK